MRLYVIYEIPTDEIDPFFPELDPIWTIQYKKFEDLGEAERFIEIHKKAFNIRNIIGPLFLARSLEKDG